MRLVVCRYSCTDLCRFVGGGCQRSEEISRDQICQIVGDFSSVLQRRSEDGHNMQVAINVALGYFQVSVKRGKSFSMRSPPRGSNRLLFV
jgi:hypothetical protein